MYCTQCGRELPESTRFCCDCGRATGFHPQFPQSSQGTQVPLSRPMREKRIAGVCAGFARYLGVDVSLVRILWLVVALMAGVGFIVYLAAWIAMPKDEGIVPSTNAAARADQVVVNG